MCIRLKHRIFLLSLIIFALVSAGYLMYQITSKIPDKITLQINTDNVIDLNIPFTAEIELEDVSGSSVASVNFNNPVTISTGDTATYKLNFKLFGLINYKNIEINVVDTKELYACGIPVGIYLKSEGILVINTTGFTDISGKTVSPADGVLLSGDYITAVGGVAVSDKMEFAKMVSDSNGNPVNLTINRNDNILNVKVTPMPDENGDYKLGIWIRDDMQGIGTLTYIDAEGNFGALGHGISDIDTGTLFEVNDGILYNANIYNIVKGSSGSPGEYVGTIDYSSVNILGIINSNSVDGVFGNILSNADYENTFEKYEAAYRYDVKTGSAYIISGTGTDTHKYEINIDYVDYTTGNTNKSIEFTVTDAELIELTGGIVQGMSGSPIIQNGRIIGAVTHVFVNDPTKGYGIFIENMLEE